MLRSLLAAMAACALVPATSMAATHTVAPGETLWGIAYANNLATSAVAAANGLSPEARVVAGTNLTIPAPGQAPTPPVNPAPSAPGTTTAPAATGGGGYLVQAGDTLSGIAVRQGVSLSALAAANGLGTDSWAIQGTTLRLPGSGQRAGRPGRGPARCAGRPGGDGRLQGAPRRHAERPGGRGARARGPDGVHERAEPHRAARRRHDHQAPHGRGDQPHDPRPGADDRPAGGADGLPGRLSAGQVGTLAAQSGAPSSLAAAIAWQESGFNNAMISPANARGVMQVMPGTWSWVQANLSSTRLDPSSPTDNVKAGSLYLAHLLRETNGDPALAAAGYYQGLDSVRRIGMLPETQRYVANVLALRGRFGG